MSPDREDELGDYEEDLGEDGPRSIFTTTWFRAIVVVIALVVVAVVALPYLLDWISPPTSGPAVTGPTLTAPSPPLPASPPSLPPASSPAAEPISPGLASETAPASSAVAPAPGRPAAPPSAEPAAARATEPGRVEPSETVDVTPGTAKSEPMPGAEAARTTRPAPARPTRAPRATTGKPSGVAAGGGPFWVQVGAFRDEGHAKALAARLRADNLRVEETRSGDSGGGPATAGASPAPMTAGDKYDVFVSGASSEDVNVKLAGRGLSADPVAGGAVIRPSLPLRDAVALSKDLATEGLKVQVRRAAGPARTPQVATTTAGDVLYRVRVAGFRDRASAEEARKALAGKGFPGFVGRGGG